MDKVTPEQIAFCKEYSEDIQMDKFNDAKRFKLTGKMPDRETIYKLTGNASHDVLEVYKDKPSIFKEKGQPDFHNPGQMGFSLYNTSGNYKDKAGGILDYYSDDLINAVLASDLSIDPLETIRELIKSSNPD